MRARREVILSAGALLSPQLLHLSGVGAGPQLQSLGIARTGLTGPDLQELKEALPGCKISD